MCIGTGIVILLSQPKLKGGFNMAFSMDDIQKAFKTAKNSGLGDFMFQEPSVTDLPRAKIEGFPITNVDGEKLGVLPVTENGAVARIEILPIANH